MKNVSILGATGSIGRSTLDVIARHPDEFRLFAVSANTQVERMLEVCLRYRPRVAVMSDAGAAAQLARALAEHNLSIEVLSGEAGLVAIAEDPAVDAVMAAIVGAVGLMPTLAEKTLLWPTRRAW